MFVWILIFFFVFIVGLVGYLYDWVFVCFLVRLSSLFLIFLFLFWIDINFVDRLLSLDWKLFWIKVSNFVKFLEFFWLNVFMNVLFLLFFFWMKINLVDWFLSWDWKLFCIWVSNFVKFLVIFWLNVLIRDRSIFFILIGLFINGILLFLYNSWGFIDGVIIKVIVVK